MTTFLHGDALKYKSNEKKIWKVITDIHTVITSNLLLMLWFINFFLYIQQSILSITAKKHQDFLKKLMKLRADVI